jgi:hypothetical protein
LTFSLWKICSCLWVGQNLHKFIGKPEFAFKEAAIDYSREAHAFRFNSSGHSDSSYMRNVAPLVDCKQKEKSEREIQRRLFKMPWANVWNR